MAEFEAIAEFSEEAADGFEDAAAEDAEGAEDLDPEEEEELEEDVGEAKESASKMQKVINSLKEIDVVAVLKKFGIFVAQQAAIGVVFYGVNVALSKITKQSKTDSGGQKDATQKLAKTKALSALITDISTISNNVTDWLKAHQSDTITIDGDITVPLTDIFIKYTTRMEKSMEASYAVAQEITQKNPSTGKVQFLTPTTSQMVKVVTSSKDFISALGDFWAFAKKKQNDFPNLSSLPLTQANMDKLNADLAKVDGLPY